MSATWTIVKFISDNSVEAVPTSWVAEGKCAWPNYTRERLMKAIRTCEPPMCCWNHHEIKPFRNATYNNYATARQKSMRAEETPDLNSDCDKEKRVSKRTKTFSADFDYEQSDDSSCSDKHTEVEVISEFPQIEIQRADEKEHESPNNLGSSNTMEKELSSGPTFNGAVEKCTCCAIHKHETANNNGFLKQIIRKLK
ncbi:hypothetical protein JTB14_038445 [Gonioctena quinquepunctata]|nr:hypothetical protein JTB14_038445 [Gonioctena quinquepunctata]